MSDIELKKIRDFGSIISDTFTYIRVHFKTYGLAILYYVIPVLILAAIIIGIGYVDLLSETLDSASEDIPEDTALAFFGKFVFGLLFYFISFGLLTAITLTHVKLVRDGEKNIQPIQLIERIIPKLFGLLAIYIMTLIGVMIGSIFFFLPGIFIGIRISLTSVIYIIEDISVGDAFSRSWELIQDYWWFTFGLMIVMAIIGYLISSTLSVPMLILAMFAGFAGATDAGSLSTIIGIMYSLMIALSTIFQIVPLLSYSLHYFNLVERKEGSGLRSRIETLDNPDL